MTASDRITLIHALHASGLSRAAFARSLVIRVPPKRGITPRQLRNLLDGTCAVQPAVLKAAQRLAAEAVANGEA